MQKIVIAIVIEILIEIDMEQTRQFQCNLFYYAENRQSPSRILAFYDELNMHTAYVITGIDIALRYS